MWKEPKITFRIIRRCSFDCPGCSTFSTLTRKGAIRVRDFRKAVDILATHDFRGTMNISGGEPTFHRGLPDMIRYASARLPSARIAVFTHGDWVGRRGWRRKLKRLAGGDNVLLRFSMDPQHVQGAILASGSPLTDELEVSVERERMAKARLFRDACTDGGIPFDFAFKGSSAQARRYLRELGEAPVYLIRFRAEPDKRPKEPGFFAVDVQEDSSILVYPSLGHIPAGEPLGGIETLPAALELNRKAVR
jgi:hypothetical protein